MSTDAGTEGATDPLDAVAEAGGARVRADVDEDADAVRSAHEQLMRATTAAMEARIPLRDITAAEARGEESVRKELRSDTLKKVERARRQLGDAEDTYRTAIARAVRLGLSTRDIAHAADTTHGTIRAITQRRGDRRTASPPAGAHAPETAPG